MSIRILPSVLKVPEGNVKKAIESVAPFVDGIHYDVMDGDFVPVTTFTAEDFKKLQWSMFSDIHLMVNDPEDWIADFAKAGASLLTIHYEARQKSVRGTLEKIKALGCLAGLSIKPKTLLSEVPDDLWEYADVALIMSVEPGYGGQSFISEVLDKVKTLRKKHQHKDINIDGGITDLTAPKAVHAGCTMLVSGTYIFSSKNYQEAITKLRIL